MFVGADFPEDTLVIYKELEMNVTALVGETVLFSFVSATLNSIFVTRYQMDGLTLGITTLGPLGEIRNVSLPRDGLKYEVTLTVVFNNHTIVRSSTLTVYGMCATLSLCYFHFMHLSFLLMQNQLSFLTFLQICWTSLWGTHSPLSAQ